MKSNRISSRVAKASNHFQNPETRPHWPRAAFIDYATTVDIARQMALIHINQDLKLALRKNTPGLDADWKCVGGVVADCQNDFFTKLEALLVKWGIKTRLLPADRFDIPTIRDNMRENLKAELSLPGVAR